MITEILERADIENIAQFLMTGSEVSKKETEKDILEMSREIKTRLETYIESEKELTEMISQINNFNGMTEDMLFRYGMKAGVKLLYQLICQP